MAIDPGFSLKDYDYAFPPELVAAAPAARRDASRLLVLRRADGRVEHRAFSDLPQYLREGDCLVVNRSRVLPARLVGRKATGGKAELVLVAELEPGTWSALSADLKPGTEVRFEGSAASAAALGKTGDGLWRLKFSDPAVRALAEKIGLAPLPPYILKRRKALSGSAPALDQERYQTVYARERGSIAAPTAGLHFTPEILAKLRAQGVGVAEIILHVGLGTFKPVTAEDVREHPMAAESFEIPPEAAEALAETRLRGGRFVAVGTTAARTLETFARNPGEKSGATSLFITPGHEFRMVDVLVTNFHQPASTPILLASAFAGRERLLAAYAQAVAEKYRLFSYGDSMVIL